MFNSSKLQCLQKFLSHKMKSSSKQIPFNLQNNKIHPNSYNDRFSSNNKINTKDSSNNHYSKDNIPLKKSNSLEKSCYNNINLLSNFIQNSDNTNSNKNHIIKFDSFNNSKDPNKSTLSNASGSQNINNINNINITITKSSPKYDKSLFIHTMKYFTINAKSTPIKLQDLDNFFMPIKNLIKTNQKNKISDNKSYIGVDENFNLTFGKSNNKIEINTSNNNNTSKPKTKSCDTMKQKFIPLNKKINLSNILNNISILKNNNIKKNETSQAKTDRNNRISLGNEKKSEKIENNKIINNISNNLSYGSISQNKDEMNQSKTSYQFRPRNMNLPKNTAIDLDSLKLNNQMMQNIIHNKKNSLNNSKNYYNNISKDYKNNIVEVRNYKTSIDKNNESNDENKNNKNNNNYNNAHSANIININKMISQKKINNNKLNFNYFNRDYSGKKKK